ncbi:agamous-like MADS-box protein [Musa troglodytarum]|uniref:Agamous-like MADS-box protein n=1 Tax=Musa troglodytarum TaxID=320322 RepID=A0A9E7JV41_9LILI|nr:agamous-like MADS-box protein [Musa troglodytarum]
MASAVKSKRASRGRQKIRIKKIENPERRAVTFSKRRKGLFVMAAELCAYTGAHAAVIVFSPSGRPYACSYPSVDEVLRRFLVGQFREGAGLERMQEGDERAAEAHRGAELEELQRGVEEMEKLRRLVLAKADVVR